MFLLMFRTLGLAYCWLDPKYVSTVNIKQTAETILEAKPGSEDHMIFVSSTYQGPGETETSITQPASLTLTETFLGAVERHPPVFSHSCGTQRVGEGTVVMGRTRRTWGINPTWLADEVEVLVARPVLPQVALSRR